MEEGSSITYNDLLRTPEGRLRILKTMPVDLILQMPRSNPDDIDVWVRRIDGVAKACDSKTEDGTIALAMRLRNRIMARKAELKARIR